MQFQSRKLVLLAMMVAFSLALRVIESLLPLNAVLVPGLKLGLANIITVVMLYRFTAKETLTVSVLRVVLGAFLGGGLSAFLFSMAGALLSFFVMFLLKAISRFSLSVLGVSIVGAVFFNVGQLGVASFLLDTKTVFTYLPIMGILSILTGFFIGFVSKLIIEHRALWKNFER